MTQDLLVLLPAILRVAVLAFVVYSSVRHNDWLGIAIGLVWSVALCVSTFTEYRVLASIVATPLVCLVAWGIIKRQRGVK